MWKCSNCGEICKSAYCDKCGLPKEESVFDELPEEDAVSDTEAPELVGEECEFENEEPTTEDENTETQDDELLTVCINGEEIPVYGKMDEYSDEGEYIEYDELEEPRNAEYHDEDDEYIEPVDLVESKIAKSKREAKSEEKREKRVAELEEKLKGERVNRNQVPASYKYEVKAKQLRVAFVAVIVFVVVVSVAVLFVMGRSWKVTGEKAVQTLRAENESQKAKISSLESQLGDLKAQMAELEKENDSLAEMNEAVRVLESDGTYHMYGCEEIDSDLIWIYGKEQIIGDSRYIKCEKCN